MTTTEATDSEGTSEQSRGTRAWGDIAVSFASTVSGLAESRRGELAGLRRMNPDEPDEAAFWRLMAGEGLLGSPAVEVKWGLVLHGIALMTPTERSASSRSAHNGQTPVGRALFLGGDTRRDSGFYSETRLNRLLTARGPMLRTLLTRMFRMLASANVIFNWREMANFILADEYDEEAAERARRSIARDYYQAERRSAQTSNEQDN